MSISGYSSSLSIPPYPGQNLRINETKAQPRDTTRADQQSTTAPRSTNSDIPSTGLLNTVV